MEKQEKKSVGLVTLDMVKKHQTKSSMYIAKLLFNLHPQVFKSVENARLSVRRYRGAIGKGALKTVTESGDYTPRIIMPDSEEENLETYIIEDLGGPLIIGGDLHVPYHDQDAFEIMIEYAYKVGASTLMMCGDFLDFYQASRFQKDPRKRSIPEEIGFFNSILDLIAKALPDTKLIFKVGNHEARLDAYIQNNAPALFGLEEIKLENLLHLKKRGIDFVKSGQLSQYKKLNVIHGHEYQGGFVAPVNPARGLYLKTKSNAVQFHSHVSSSHTEKDITGKITSCWSGGCLCDLKPAYAPFNKWGLGFIEVQPEDDMFAVKNHSIVNYRLV